jgi:hypothetical protein
MRLRLKDLEAMDCDFLTASQVAQVTGSGENFIRYQAHEDPDSLGYPVCVQGRKVKIPREGFIFWAKYGRPVVVGNSGEGK